MANNAAGTSENSLTPLHMDPLSATDFVRLQQQLRRFVQAIRRGTQSEQEVANWKKVLKVPDVWAKVRKYVPEFDVREDEVARDKQSALGQIHHTLLRERLLRPSLPTPLANTVDARQREQWQDWGYLLLPECMHQPWHDLIDEDFGARGQYFDIGKRGVYERIDQVDVVHRRAFQDRIFQKICSLWIWRNGQEYAAESGPYRKFVQAYHDYRRTWNAPKTVPAAVEVIYLSDSDDA